MKVQIVRKNLVWKKITRKKKIRTKEAIFMMMKKPMVSKNNQNQKRTGGIWIHVWKMNKIQWA